MPNPPPGKQTTNHTWIEIPQTGHPENGTFPNKIQLNTKNNIHIYK